MQLSIYLGLLTASALLHVTAAGTCDKANGWVWTPFGTCYKFFLDERKTWGEAQQICKGEEASLATLDTLEELKFMKGRRTNQPYLRLIPHMWFGGRRINGTWYWMDSEMNISKEIVDFDWAPGEPSGYGYKKNVGDCLNIYGGYRCFGKGNMQMDDDWCDQIHAFVCEKSQKFYKSQSIIG